MKTPAEIADVVEIQAWATNGVYTVSALKEDLEALLSDREDGESERLAQEIFDELAVRARLLGAAYPFAFDGYMLRPNELAQESSYVFCLGLSVLEAKHITAHIRNIEFET